MNQEKQIKNLVSFYALSGQRALNSDQKSYAAFVKQESEHKALLRSAYVPVFDYSKSKSDIFEQRILLTATIDFDYGNN